MPAKPNIEKGEAFMKAVVKASLYALFAIGVRSQVNIDRFVIAFTESLEKNLETAGIVAPLKTVGPIMLPTKEPDKDQGSVTVGVAPQAQEPKVSEVEPTPEVTESPVTSVPEKDDLSTIRNVVIRKALKKAGIDTMDKLITEMQQKDLTTIKGIGKKSVDEIREAVSKWNLRQL